MERIAKIGLVAAGMFLALQGYTKEGNERAPKTTITGISLRTETDSLVQLRSATGTRASVFIFLSPECPISQQCTRELQLLFERFSASGIAFYGVFPGTFYSKEDILAFRHKYRLGFPMLLDNQYALTHQLAASITPEVFVVDCAGNTCYSGAIDNTYYALGKKNARTTEHYLEAALTSRIGQKEILIKRTTPIGCLVEGLKKR